MDTTIKDGLIVEPRSYQLYGDDIESKQAVEPISIVSGTGPICGFNHLYYSSNDATSMVISGTGSNSRYGGGELEVIAPHKHVVISNKSNEAGSVVNAYTTPDGLVHVAPDYIRINNSPIGGWPSLQDPFRAVVFALKAKHTYTDQEVESDVPSDTNFEVTWISDIANSNLDLLKVLKGDYNDLLESLPEGWLDTNTETLIGLYIVGWDSNWEYGNNSEVKDLYKPIFKSLNYKLGLIPYNGTWPVKAIGMGPLDYLVNELKLKLLDLRLTDLKNTLVNYIPDKSLVTRMFSPGSVTLDVLAEEARSIMGSLALTISPNVDDPGGTPNISIGETDNFTLQIDTESCYWKDTDESGNIDSPVLHLRLYRQIYDGELRLVKGSVQVGMNYSRPMYGDINTLEIVPQSCNLFYKLSRVSAGGGIEGQDRYEVDMLDIYIFGITTQSITGGLPVIELYISGKYRP